MDSVSDQIRKQYGDYAVKVAYEWVPYSDDENELKTEALSVAQQAYNVYVKAREEINRNKEPSAVNYIEECLVEHFDPIQSEEEIVKKMVSCAVAKAIFYREDYYEEE